MQRYPWFDEAYLRLLDTFRSGNLPHAMILSGPEGCGKSEFALFLARALNCGSVSQQSARTEPCGTCRSCQLLDGGAHPDIVHLIPEEGSQFIKVDQIRQINEFVAQSGQISALKVVVLDSVSALNINAANALLKSLEEPASNTLYLLLDNQMGTLLPTIRSRCQTVKLPVPDTADAKSWLSVQGEEDYTESDILSALSLAHGAPLKAREFLKLNSAEQERKLVKLLAETIKNEKSVVEFAEEFPSTFELGTSQFIECQIKWLELMILAGLSSDMSPVLEREGGKMFEYLLRGNEIQSFFVFRDELLARRNDLMHGSTINGTLLLQSFAIRWGKLMLNARAVK